MTGHYICEYCGYEGGDHADGCRNYRPITEPTQSLAAPEMARPSVAQIELPICGIKDFIGCNCQIERVSDLYRCTDCGVAMHKSCLLAHFNGAHRPHPLRETQLMEALAEKERELIRARASSPLSRPKLCGGE